MKCYPGRRDATHATLIIGFHLAPDTKSTPKDRRDINPAAMQIEE
jgi:hypothetical protein